MAQNTKVARSPYAKNRKAPYKPSEHYERWNRAVGVAGAGIDSPEAIEADARFRQVFDVPRFDPYGHRLDTPDALLA